MQGPDPRKAEPTLTGNAREPRTDWKSVVRALGGGRKAAIVADWPPRRAGVRKSRCTFLATTRFRRRKSFAFGDFVGRLCVRCPCNDRLRCQSRKSWHIPPANPKSARWGWLAKPQIGYDVCGCQ